MATAFKTFPAVLPAKDLDYGLELAVRRRRTKSLQGEDQLRKKLIASLCLEQTSLLDKAATPALTSILDLKKVTPLASNVDISSTCLDVLYPISNTRTISDINPDEDWFGTEVVVPRDTDRILEQFVLMLLRISVYMKKEKTELTALTSNSEVTPRQNKKNCTAMPSEETETPHFVGNSSGKIASYLRDYPHIFGKKSDVFGSFHTVENTVPSVRSNPSYQNATSTKAVSTDTSLRLISTSPVQESRDMQMNSQIKDPYSENISKESADKPTDFKVTSAPKIKHKNKIETKAESKKTEIKPKAKCCEPKAILNLNKKNISKSSDAIEENGNCGRTNKNTPKNSKSFIRNKKT